MTIKDWLEGLSYKLVQGSLDVEVNEVVYDSRRLLLARCLSA